MKERFFKWRGWRAAGKTACFLLLLALTLGRVDAVLSIKEIDGLYSMKTFYRQEKGTVDVLVLGSSHAYVNIDPGTLWEEYGTAAYDLGGGIQPFWNTYYFLKEALKTQTPRLIVLEAYTTAFTGEYGDNGRAASNTFGMKWSRDKLEAIRLSAPPDRQSSFILDYTQYHNRWRYLSREDFMEYKGDRARYACWKGSFVSGGTGDLAWPEDARTEERAPMAEKTETWYRKTIELAQASGVPLLIVVNPYPAVTAEEQAVYNTASDIASEYGVPFVNFNRDFGGLDLDPAADFYDGHHMNVWGSRKFTKQLGQYLTEHYDLPDRRGDPAYQSWEENAQYIEAYARDGKLARGVSAEEAAALLLDPDYTCAVSVSGNGGAAYGPLLEALGIPAGEAGMWLVSAGEVLWSSGPGGGTEYFELDGHDLKLTAGPEGNAMVYDRENIQPAADSVSVFVYDAVTQAQAAYLAFDAAGL